MYSCYFIGNFFRQMEQETERWRQQRKEATLGNGAELGGLSPSQHPSQEISR